MFRPERSKNDWSRKLWVLWYQYENIFENCCSILHTPRNVKRWGKIANPVYTMRKILQHKWDVKANNWDLVNWHISTGIVTRIAWAIKYLSLNTCLNVTIYKDPNDSLKRLIFLIVCNEIFGVISVDFSMINFIICTPGRESHCFRHNEDPIKGPL